MTCPHLTDAQQLSIDSMRTFVRNEIQPVAASLRYGSATRSQLLELLQAVAEFGLPGMAVSAESGGLGVDWVVHGRLFEELVRGSGELAQQVLVNTLAATLLVQHPALAERYLPGLMSGSSIAVIAPGGQPDEPRPGLGIARNEEPSVVEGSCEHMAGSRWADLLLCAAREVDGKATYVLLDPREDYFEFRNAHHQGLNDGVFLQVIHAQVPKARQLGSATADSPLTRHLLDSIKLHDAVVQVARGQQLLDGAQALASSHSQLGHPLVAQPMIAVELAELDTQLEAARLMYGLGFLSLNAGRIDNRAVCRARLLASTTARQIEQRVRLLEERIGLRHDPRLHVEPITGLFPRLIDPIALDGRVVARGLTGDLA